MTTAKVQKETSMTRRITGRVRTSVYSPWQDYDSQAFSTFEQATISHPGPPYKWGGPWFMIREWDRGNTITGSTNLIQGSMMLGNRSQAYSPMSAYATPTESEEDSIAARLWRSAVPTKPEFDLPVFVGEMLRDGIPQIPGVGTWKDLTNPLRGASGDYLNFQFGWAPLASGIKDFTHAVRNSHKLLAGFTGIEGGSRHVKRRRQLPTLSEYRYYTGNFVVLPSKANVFTKSGGSVEYREQKTWFVGNFRYFVPVGDDLASRLHRYKVEANRLYGVRLTPDVLWNLTPWSWAVDWFADVGGLIESISQFGPDGIHAHEAFLMRSNLIRSSMWGVVDSKNVSGSLYRETGYETKYRRQASPFGFDMRGMSDMSLKQLSIMAALGLNWAGPGIPQSR